MYETCMQPSEAFLFLLYFQPLYEVPAGKIALLTHAHDRVKYYRCSDSIFRLTLCFFFVSIFISRFVGLCALQSTTCAKESFYRDFYLYSTLTVISTKRSFHFHFSHWLFFLIKCRPIHFILLRWQLSRVNNKKIFFCTLLCIVTLSRSKLQL